MLTGDGGGDGDDGGDDSGDDRTPALAGWRPPTVAATLSVPTTSSTPSSTPVSRLNT